MKIMLALLAARALLATPIYLSGSGSFSQSPQGNSVTESFTGTNGFETVAVTFSASGAAANIGSGFNMNPSCCMAAIDGFKSPYFSFSIASHYLELYNASGNLMLAAGLSGFVVMDDPVYVDPTHPSMGYNQGFSIVSVPEPGMAWLVGLALIGLIISTRTRSRVAW